MEEQSLNKFEHYTLDSTMNGLEPLNVIYNDFTKRFPETTLDMIITILVKLTKTSLIDCYFERRVCKELTEEQLRKHCSGRSEENLRSFPDKAGEYYFLATQKGREEDSKDIYDAYYYYSESDESWHVVGGKY